MADAVVVAYVEARYHHHTAEWLEFASSYPHPDRPVFVSPVSVHWLTSEARSACAVTCRLLAARLVSRSRTHNHGSGISSITQRIAQFVPWCSMSPGPITILAVACDLERRLPDVTAEPSVPYWAIALRRPTADDNRVSFSGRDLIVRVLALDASFGAEQLNTYFGRYGFISDTRLGEETGTPSDANAAVPQDTSLGRPLYRYVFVVRLDSVQHAESALLQLDTFANLRDGPSSNTSVANPIIDFVSYGVNISASVSGIDQWAIFPIRAIPPPSALLEACGVTLATVSESEIQATDGRPGDSFVPEIVIDNVPYWTTYDQLVEHFAQSGTVRSVRIALNDRTGAFAGCAAVRMASFSDAVQAAANLNGREISGETVVCGVLDRDLNIVNIIDPSEVLMASRRTNRGVLELDAATEVFRAPPPQQPMPGSR